MHLKRRRPCKSCGPPAGRLSNLASNLSGEDLNMAHKCIKMRSQHSERCFVGMCPACRKPVLWDTPDGPVWTCPADLKDSNPFHEPANERITEELREKVRGMDRSE